MNVGWQAVDCGDLIEREVGVARIEKEREWGLGIVSGLGREEEQMDALS
jgi:hypothetical protein